MPEIKPAADLSNEYEKTESGYKRKDRAPFESINVSDQEITHKSVIELISKGNTYYIKLSPKNHFAVFESHSNHDQEDADDAAIMVENLFGTNDTVAEIGKEVHFVKTNDNSDYIIPVVEKIIIYPDGKEIEPSN